MNTSYLKALFKPVAILVVLLISILVMPDSTLFEWKYLRPRQVLVLITVLVAIHILGTIGIKLFGVKMGSVLSGFLGGLISSTATTASLARRSKNSLDGEAETLVFLSATCAMLVEGMVLVMISQGVDKPALLLIFVLPIIVTVFMITFRSRKSVTRATALVSNEIQILEIVKLSAFIFLILILSKLLQVHFGNEGLYVLTFLVSLFEIHGSIIANVQMYSSRQIEMGQFTSLLTLSIAASYISKLFLVFVLGSRLLFLRLIRYTLFLVLILSFGWLASQSQF